MRLRQSRLETYYHRKRMVKKDKEAALTKSTVLLVLFLGNPGLLPGKSRRSSMDSDLGTSVM